MRVCVIIVAIGVAAVALSSAYEQAGNAKMLNGRQITSTLFLSNAFDAGNWGPVATCTENSFVNAFEIMFNPPDNFDETAVNGVKLYCSTEEGHADGYETSATGPEGSWLGMRVCTEGFVTGFRGKVLPFEGVFTDDVAVEDFQAECMYGLEIIEGINRQGRSTKAWNAGQWSVWAQCPVDTAVCGLQTRVEPPQLADDDTAVTDINLFCCERVANATTIA